MADKKNLSHLATAIGRADCAVRAVAVCCDTEYSKVERLMKRFGRKDGSGTDWSIIVRSINKLGYALVYVDTPCRTIRTLQRDLPKTGSFLISVRGHVAGFRDGAVIDWAAGRCKHIRSVWRIKRFRNLTQHEKQYYMRGGQMSPSGTPYRCGMKVPHYV